MSTKTEVLSGLQAYLAEFPARDDSKEPMEHSHEGSEFLFLLQGQLALRFQGVEHELNEGDSVYMESIEMHGYRSLSESPARAIVVTLPPRGV